MNSDVCPSTCIALHRRPAPGRCSHQYATAIAKVMMPARMKKKAGELVQKSDRAYGVGRNDAAYAADASPTAPAARRTFRRASSSDVRARSIRTPATAPAGTNAAHGKVEKFVSPGIGRM